jgi:hypothetical protein
VLSLYTRVYSRERERGTVLEPSIKKRFIHRSSKKYLDPISGGRKCTIIRTF